MTREETIKIILMIKSTYPKTYEKFTKSDFEKMALAWQLVFEDYSYQQISLGLKAYMTTNTSGFPPVPAQLISYTQETPPTKEMSSNEAWALVLKAIKNGIYGAEEEFEKLPELCKKAIGNAASIRELAQMDSNTVQSVEGSHFKRNYETLAKRQKEYEKIPESTRAMLESLHEPLMIEGDNK